MQHVEVTQHPASVDAYIRHGWSLVAIPFGTKGPRTPGWNKRENALKSQSDLPAGYGIGLSHAYSGTMALDIDNWDQAKVLLMRAGVDLDQLYSAPDAVIIDSGRQGRGKLLYAMNQPLASRKITVNKAVIYELRCATSSMLTVQDVLPPTIHPETMQPYRWAGRGHWSRLPMIPDALLELWTGMLRQDDEKSISTDTAINTSWAEIKSALEFIPADVSRDEWIAVGMALHWAGSQSDMAAAFQIWDEWSQQSETKYPGQREVSVQWRSFDSTKPTPVKLGTLFHIARKHGWTRPQIDASALFTQAMLPPPELTLMLRPPAPRINIDLFPSVLAQRARELEISVGCDPLVPLWAGLAAACGAADAQIRLELMEGWKVPPVLWLMTIGDPSQKKTPGSTPMFQTLRALEQEDRPRHAKAMLAWEGKEASYAAQKKHFLEWSSSPEALVPNAAIPTVPDLEPQPASLRIVVSDITSQKLVRDAAERPRGLLCYLDEMNSWVKKLTDPRSGDDRSSWVVSFESQPYEMDRVGGGTIRADNLAVAIYGNIQPTVFHQHQSQLASDGLLQRFLIAVLPDTLRGINQPLDAWMTNQGVWDMTLRIVHSLPPMTFRLSPEAFQLFRQFQVWYNERKHDERLLMASDAFMTAFGKLEGMVGRIALVFHLIESPFSPTVSADTLNRVIQLVKTYIIPALRYAYDNEGQGALDRWVADWIIQHWDDYPSFTLTDLKRAARRQTSQCAPHLLNQAFMSALYPLEQAHWIKRIDDGTQEARGFVQFIVNPELGEKFNEHRREVINAKQRRMDEIYKDNPKDTVHHVHGYEPD